MADGGGRQPAAQKCPPFLGRGAIVMKLRVVLVALLLAASATLARTAAADPGFLGAPPSGNPESAWQTDLAVTDIFLDRLKNGNLWVRITNHGPRAIHGRQAELIVVIDGGGLLLNFNLSVVPGQTRTLNTGLVVDASKRTRDITVTVRVPGMRDLRPGNNTYRERVP
jgi:hypothetical protein